MKNNFTYNTTPQVNFTRSKQYPSYGNTFSMSMGRLYPFYVEEVLPGDSFKVKDGIVARLTSNFIKPIYGNLFLDTYYFFVPSRLVFDKWAEIFGENNENSWKRRTEVRVPMIPYNSVYNGNVSKVFEKSLADYLEMPLGYLTCNVSVLYFRAIAKIWNDWFRDENYMAPMNIETGDFQPREILNNSEWSPDNYTGLCPPVCKMHDMFTSVLPEPQKGDSVDVLPGGFYPLVAGDNINNLNGFMRVSTDRDEDIGSNTFKRNLYYATKGPSDGGINLPDNSVFIDMNTSEASSGINGGINGTNLGVNPNSFTVNDLRIAFQTQRMLERDALYGTRYVEHISSMFGVQNPDARLQIPEFLGGKRIPLNIQQVANTSGSGSTSANTLGQLGGYSLSNGNSGFSKAFTEYGMIIGLCCIRQYHTYQQGVPRRYTRERRLDFYNPLYAHIGNQPVYQYEIFGSSSSSSPLNENIFGYREAWSEYRSHPNAICGQMKSSASDSLDVWHIGDEYVNAPVAGEEFIKETPNFLDRVITVSNSVQDQFIIDCWHNVEAIRVMPVRSVPGLIDHG